MPSQTVVPAREGARGSDCPGLSRLFYFYFYHLTAHTQQAPVNLGRLCLGGITDAGCRPVDRGFRGWDRPNLGGGGTRTDLKLVERKRSKIPLAAQHVVRPCLGSGFVHRHVSEAQEPKYRRTATSMQGFEADRNRPLAVAHTTQARRRAKAANRLSCRCSRRKSGGPGGGTCGRRCWLVEAPDTQ